MKDKKGGWGTRHKNCMKWHDLQMSFVTPPAHKKAARTWEVEVSFFSFLNLKSGSLRHCQRNGKMTGGRQKNHKPHRRLYVQGSSLCRKFKLSCLPR